MIRLGTVPFLVFGGLAASVPNAEAGAPQGVRSEPTASATAFDPNFQSTPEGVLSELIRAANARDYSNLHALCAPDGSGDGDTREFICGMTNSTEGRRREYDQYFATAYLRDAVVYRDDTHATVPFWFNHPSGESRANEQFEMVKFDDKWYLLSF